MREAYEYTAKTLESLPQEDGNNTKLNQPRFTWRASTWRDVLFAAGNGGCLTADRKRADGQVDGKGMKQLQALQHFKLFVSYFLPFSPKRIQSL